MKYSIFSLLSILFVVPQQRAGAQTFVEHWGTLGDRNEWAILNDSTTAPGSASIGGNNEMTDWASLVGWFGNEIQLTSEGLTISGKLEIVGDTLDTWNPLRFGIFHFDSLGTLENQYTDSAAWSGIENSAHGYLFTPQTAANGGIGGQGGNGNQWAVNGGSWMSTWSGGTVSLGQVEQTPRRAVLYEGLYEFNISIIPLDDGTTEVRWYLIDDSAEHYLMSEISIDTSNAVLTYNAFAFAAHSDAATFSQIDLTQVKIESGFIELPYIRDPNPFYLDKWGIINGSFGDGSWRLIPRSLVGDATVSGNPSTQPVVLVASFGRSLSTQSDYGIALEGEINFTGGGFEDENSFTIGIFDSSNMSQDSTESHGYIYNVRSDSHTGYLIAPGQTSVYAVSDSSWHDVSSTKTPLIGTGHQEGTPSMGDYQFTFGVQAVETGTLIRFKIEKDDASFYSSGYLIDSTSIVGTDKFNLITFGISNSTTSEVFIEAVSLDMRNLVTVEYVNNDIPYQTVLNQNYPNPFNPNTVISYQLPTNSKVSLRVFDVLGREVATLVDGIQTAGKHSANFDASTLSSGVYLYRLETTHFVRTKKMLLIK